MSYSVRLYNINEDLNNCCFPNNLKKGFTEFMSNKYSRNVDKFNTEWGLFTKREDCPFLQINIIIVIHIEITQQKCLIAEVPI